MRTSSGNKPALKAASLIIGSPESAVRKKQRTALYPLCSVYNRQSFAFLFSGNEPRRAYAGSWRLFYVFHLADPLFWRKGSIVPVSQRRQAIHYMIPWDMEGI